MYDLDSVKIVVIVSARLCERLIRIGSSMRGLKILILIILPFNSGCGMIDYLCEDNRTFKEPRGPLFAMLPQGTQLFAK